MSVEILTNGCGVDMEYATYDKGVYIQNPNPTSTISISFASYPDVIMMIYFTVTTEKTSSSFTRTVVFMSCKNDGYSFNASYDTQGYLYASDYSDTSGISAGKATIRFNKTGNTLNVTISDIKYANGDVIYMPSQTARSASYNIQLYGYNNI